MNIQEKITAYREKDAALQKEARGLKLEFEAFLRDKTIPLLERWNTFVAAHEDLKNHKTSLLHGKSEGLQHIMENWFDAPEVIGRGTIIYTANMMSDCVNKKGFHPENLYYDFMEDDDDKEKTNIDGQRHLEEVLEEILEQNVGSFTFDW